MSVLCISYYCPHLCSPGPRWPSQNLIYNLLWDIDASQRWRAAPCCRSNLRASVQLNYVSTWEDSESGSNKIIFCCQWDLMFPDGMAQQLHQQPPKKWPRDKCDFALTYSQKRIQKANRFSICPPAVQLCIKQSGNKKEAQGIFEKNTSKNKILCISDVVNSWFELASSWNFSSLVCMLI